MLDDLTEEKIRIMEKKNNDFMEIENKWKTLLKIIEWIKFSDAKAIVVITVYGIMIGFYFDTEILLSSFNRFQKCLFYLILLTSVISILFSFLTLNPRLKSVNKKHSLFFGNIAQFESFNEFKNDYNKIFKNEKIISVQLSEQIFTNSKIAWEKFKFVSYSLRFMFISFLLIVVFITCNLMSL